MSTNQGTPAPPPASITDPLAVDLLDLAAAVDAGTIVLRS